jgi:hypothetical protein
MNKTLDSLSIWLETLAVLVLSAFIASIIAFYAVIYEWIPFFPFSTIITFDQLATAALVGAIVGLIVAIAYDRLRRH